MKEIEEAVKKFKSRNGGEVTFSTKELVIGIWEKIEKLNEKIDGLPCVQQCTSIERLETRQKMTMWFIGIVTAILAIAITATNI